MFDYNEEYGEFQDMIDQITFSARSPEGAEEQAERLADAYSEKLPDIAEALCGDDYFVNVMGRLSPEEVMEKLGDPKIDLTNSMLIYADHGFELDCTIELEFDGDLDELLDLSINEN